MLMDNQIEVGKLVRVCLGFEPLSGSRDFYGTVVKIKNNFVLVSNESGSTYPFTYCNKHELYTAEVLWAPTRS